VRDPREPRLPKWAQAELATLRRELDVERQRNEELRGAIPETDTFVRDYGREDRPLPKGSRVAFHLKPDTGHIRRSVIVHVEGDRLEVQGDYGLVVYPRASNSVRLMFEEFYR
jgi:hypothetical protein